MKMQHLLMLARKYLLMSNVCIITLDGPAGVGKSTLARGVAKALDLPYMDSGAMFRILALKFGKEILEMSETQIKEALEDCKFSIQGTGDESKMCCNGIAAGDEIRTEEIADIASQIAAIAAVREFLREAQRELGKTTSLVCEGRDMGSAIFTQAACKFFLDATPEERARRRSRQLEEMGKAADYSTVLDQIITRDAKDRNRKESPLRPANDAILIDTTDRTPEQVLDKLLAHTKRLQSKACPGLGCKS